jgi:hypothetical protein
MSSSETFRRAFPERETPKVSYGIPFPAAAAQHVEINFQCLTRLYYLLGFIGMTPQTPWSEVLEITKDSRAANADLLITLGGGSLTDAAELVSFVCNPGRSLG